MTSEELRKIAVAVCDSACVAPIGTPMDRATMADESADGWEKLLQMAREVLR